MKIKILSMLVAVMMIASIFVLTACDMEMLKGPQGVPGKTPYIQDGYWYIDGASTGVKAEGSDGEDLTACQHEFGEWIVVYEPTCESIGVNYRTCSKCSEIEHNYIEKLGHTFSDVYVLEDLCIGSKVLQMCTICNTAKVDMRTGTIHEYENGYCKYCGVTSEEYFTFTLLDDNTYSIKAKDISNMPSEVVIPSMYNGKKITAIGDYAFSDCHGITSIIIPDSVTLIGDCAFSWCIDLISINIPDSVTHISRFIFSTCLSLTSITIPDSVTSIGDSAFYLCESLTSVVIPDSVTSIGDSAFYLCESLTSVVIPDSVTSIGNSAFKYCTSLTNVVIPDSVTSIGSSAFSGCSSLASIEVNKNNQYYKSIDGNLYSKDGKTLIQYAIGKKDTSFEIPNSVTSIGNSAFYDCSSLTSVVIGDSVASIEDWAFEGCDSLADVYYTGSAAEWADIDIGGYNSNLKNATIHYNYVSEE